MHVVTQIEDIPEVPLPCGLTIGMFDGVHLGHRHLLNSLRSRITAQGTLAVLTFSNHPMQILKTGNPPPLLCKTEQKLSLLESAGVDLVILLEFTKQLAELPYDIFFHILHRHLPFTTLLLGEGAAFGKDRQGKPQEIKALGIQMGFEAIYIEKQRDTEGQVISSGAIRSLIQQDRLDQAAALLGYRFKSL